MLSNIRASHTNSIHPSTIWRFVRQRSAEQCWRIFRLCCCFNAFTATGRAHIISFVIFGLLATTCYFDVLCKTVINLHATHLHFGTHTWPSDEISTENVCMAGCLVGQLPQPSWLRENTQLTKFAVSDDALACNIETHFQSSQISSDGTAPARRFSANFPGFLLHRKFCAKIVARHPMADGTMSAVLSSRLS